MPPPVLFHHPASADHLTGSHPEQPARLAAIEAALAARDWLGHDVRLSPAATQRQLTRVHPAPYVRAIEQACAQGRALDPDTVVSAGSWEAARRSAGGAVALVDALVGGEARVGSSLHRPPGHHAEPAQAMGFCLFANVAIAARQAIEVHGLERILVLDWDVHHGNGTQDIFFSDPRVLFCSLHQWPMWPGTGAAAEIGQGAGRGYTLNLPVPGRSGDALWCSLVAHAVVPLAHAYRPQLILVSAGYDAHADDPLADCAVTDAGFAAMSASVGALAGELDVPLGIVLEGGYDLAALARCTTETLDIVSRPDVAAPDVPEHPDVAAVRARLAPYWPLRS